MKKKGNVTNGQELATLGKGVYDVHCAIFKPFCRFRIWGVKIRGQINFILR